MALSFEKTTTGLEYKAKDLSQAEPAQVKLPDLPDCLNQFGPLQYLGREYKVMDLSQADFGRLEIELAQVKLPDLLDCLTQFGPSQYLGREYKVKDLSQADFGRLEIELAQVKLPDLLPCLTQFGPPQYLGREYKVQDLSQADFGLLEVEPPEVEMQGLVGCRAEFGPAQSLKGARITGSLHMTKEHAFLINTLTALGAYVRCFPLVIFFPSNQNSYEYWKLVSKALDWGNGVGPNLIADDGNDIIPLIREGIRVEKMYEETGQLPDPYSSTEDPNLQALRRVIGDGLESDPKRYRRMVNNLVGICQITTTGAMRILKMRDDGTVFEPSNIYDSPTKTKYDNCYGSHLSLPEGLKRATGVPILNKDVVVFGYGDVGKNCADALKEAGANVFVIKNNNPDHAFDALTDGIQVKTLDEIVSKGDIFITTTDYKDIIAVNHMKKMKNNAIICSIGQFDNDIDMQRLQIYPNVRKITVSSLANKWVFPETNNGVIVLAEGRMINLGCATGNLSFVEPCLETDQVIGLMELWKQNGSMRDA